MIHKKSSKFYIISVTLSFSLFISLIPITSSFASLSLSDTHYQQGEEIKIFADIETDEEEAITRLNVLDAENNTISDQVKIARNGTISTTYQTDSLVEGNYTLVIRYNNTEQLASFIIIEDEKENNESLPINSTLNEVEEEDTGVSVLTNKDSYSYNETITITGKVDRFVNEQIQTSIRITDPFGIFVYSEKAEVDRVGNFTTEIRPETTSEWSSSGEYRVNAAYANNDPGTTSFEFVTNETSQTTGEDDSTESTITISTDKETYETGPIVINGSTPVASSPRLVFLEVEDESDNQVHSIRTLVGAIGQFRELIPTSIVSEWGHGEFEIRASVDETLSASTTIMIVDSESTSDDTRTNEEILTENELLRLENERLNERVDELSVQVDELSEKVNELNAIILEQIRVMMNTLGMDL